MFERFFKKSQKRFGTMLDIEFIIFSLYHQFYETYGYDKKIESTTMNDFYIESLNKANLSLDKLSDEQILGVFDFFNHMSMDGGDFPLLLKKFKELPVDENSEEWRESYNSLLNYMEKNGFVS